MAHRKEVFQSKVLQKLYPAAPKLQRETSPPHTVEALVKKKDARIKVCHEETASGDAGQAESAANPRKRMYTVLPPPADYNTHPEKSFTLPRLESINNAEDPAEESVHDGDKLDQDKEEEEQKQKRKRWKRKTNLHQDPGQGEAATLCESSTCQSHTPEDEEGVHMSRNKKRKLKKKRHKEKLHSMGLMPRAAPLEFTYQKDGKAEEGEEDNERRAAELLDFLRTTMEIYMSDFSVNTNKVLFLDGTVDDLLSRISRGKDTSVLKQLCSLKDFVQQKETDRLEKALKELYNNS
ncbi:glutamate-rich protein 1 isoform X2 [Mastacembelus armatus]|nr:glutamate-rich protein 1 isoform X2 [Mastacembelus armatus]